MDTTNWCLGRRGEGGYPLAHRGKRTGTGWTPWAKAQPPDARRLALPLGLGPGGGSGNPRPGKEDSDPIMFFIIRALLSYAMSGPSTRTCLSWEVLPGESRPRQLRYWDH